MNNTLLIFVLIFIIVLSFIFLITQNFTHNKKRYWKIYLIISFCILLFFHVFKDPSSLPDLPDYMKEFSEINNHDIGYIFTHGISSGKSENGWCVFCKLIQYVIPYGFAVIFVNSIIILFGYYRSIKIYSPYIWISVLLYLTGPYIQSLYVLRQHMAMAMLLLSYPYIISRKPIHFFIILFLSFNIHQTALIFAPIYFIYGYKGNFIKIIVIVIVVGIIIKESVLSYTVWFVENAGLSGYDTYISSDQESNLKMGLYLCSIFLFRLFVLKKNASKEGINKLLTIILFISCFVEIIGVGLSFTGRLGMYFSSLLFLIVPQTAQYIQNTTIRRLFLFVILFFNIFMWLNSSNSNPNTYKLLF